MTFIYCSEDNVYINVDHVVDYTVNTEASVFYFTMSGGKTHRIFVDDHDVEIMIRGLNNPSRRYELERFW